MATSTRAMRDRILRTWERTDSDDFTRHLGATWYDTAHETSAAMGEAYEFSTPTVAGVIAALSPRCQWAVNVSFAERLLRACNGSAPWPPRVHTMNGRKQAWAIARGARPHQILNGGRGIGKTTAFWHNIMGNHTPVTVDVWAARCAEGRDWVERQPEGKRYLRIERAYQLAAATEGVAPAVMQATTWITTRGKAF